MTARRTLLCLAGVAALATAIALAMTPAGPLAWLARAVLVAAGLLGLLWLLWRVLGAFLWRVGRRLAFSYFLIGILPIPMVALLGLLGAYMQAGFFAGHLYRDAVAGVHLDLAVVADRHLADWSAGDGPPATDSQGATLAFYRDGQKVAGPRAAPDLFPSWLEEATASTAAGREQLAPFVEGADGVLTIAAVAGTGEHGALALYRGELEDELSQRSDLAVRLLRAEDAAQPEIVRIKMGRREIPLQFAFPGRDLPVEEAQAAAAAMQAGPPAPLWDRPLVVWGELSGPVRGVAGGAVVSEYAAAYLNASPRQISRHFFSSSAEVDTAVWGSVLGLASLLATIYGVALAMALYIIFTLSQAVNRLSRATAAVGKGDFAVRIPVSRRDQVGELQRNFNEMSAHLEELVAQSAQREVLEKELQIARDLQQSLLPGDLPDTEAMEFATVFEPSAAIGGDYFDILRLDADRVAVVIADVSGHGLPTGLRMAMIKAALTILVEDGRPPEEILRKLDRMVRASKESRTFVTLTLSVVDFRRGCLELTNAGHPPTYLLRAGQAQEIALPSPPLGALSGAFARREVELAPGDIVVWLSDGLFEAGDERGEPFGYVRLRAALEGAAASASVVRDRLLAAIARHTAGQPADDDRTMVVMRYRPTRDGAAPRASAGRAGGATASTAMPRSA